MQDSQAMAAADARVTAFAGGRLSVALLLAGAALTALGALAIVWTAFLLTSEDGVRALSMDFRVFWAAARLAVEGEGLAAFDMARLAAVHAVEPDDWMPWLYPPGYLLLIQPLGLMPFAWAFLCASALSVALLALALRPFVAGSRAVWIGLALAPACLPALVIGQNSLLWMAGLLAALAALRAERWVLAGVWIGCLTLKPQLGLMIPVALVAAGLWRTVFAASVTAVVLAVLPTLVFGTGYWRLLAARLAEQGDHLIAQVQDLPLMVGPFALAAQLGLPAGAAIWLQGGLVLAMAAMVFALWRAPRAGFDAKAAGLLLAILLSAPYLWYYEAALLAAAALFLVRAGALGPDLPGVGLAILLWCGAALLLVNVFADIADPRHLGALLLTPTMLGGLIALAAHVLAPPSAPPSATPMPG